MVLGLVLVSCGSPPPAETASSCAERTSARELDAFLSDLFAAARANPCPDASFAERLVARQFAPLVSRIERGLVVLDAGRARECIAHTRVMSEHESFFDPGQPCAEVARPRCAARDGTTCGIDAECDAGSYCAGATLALYGGDGCFEAGHCAPRIPLGGQCPLDHSNACARPTEGTAFCGPDPSSESVGRCARVVLVTSADACGLVTTDADHDSISICERPLVCAAQHCRALRRDVAIGGGCDFASECATGARCDLEARRCIDDATPCTARASSAGHVCVASHCVASDGTTGSACEPGSCARGHACRDGICGAPADTTDGVADELECASGCASPMADPRPRVCVPREP